MLRMLDRKKRLPPTINPNFDIPIAELKLIISASVKHAGFKHFT
jgi:hypothetical protein